MAISTTHTQDLVGLRESFAAPIVLPGDPTWDAARTPWNLSVDQQPAAVATPATAEEVQAAVRFAIVTGLRVAPQGSGHGASGVGDLSDVMLVRTTGLDEVTVDPSARRARVGAGVLWGDVVAAATPHGLTALHGSSPDVSVTGYLLGGGVSWLVRKHGLAANSITAIEFVDANCELRRADAVNDSGAFWAMRGGGAPLGVITAIEIELFPLTELFAGWLIWPWERAGEVLDAWRRWTDTAPEEASSVGRVLQLPPIPAIPEPLRGRNLVVVEVAFVGNEDEGRRLMQPLVDLDPEIDTLAMIPAGGLSRLHNDPEGPTPGIGDGRLLEELPAEAVRAFAALTGPGSGSPLISAEIRHLGGAAGRPAEDGGAVSHLSAGYAMYGVGIPFDRDQAGVIKTHIHRLLETMRPWSHDRAYFNFTEEPVPMAALFEADVRARLAEVRQAYDPDRMFVGRLLG